MTINRLRFRYGEWDAILFDPSSFLFSSNVNGIKMYDFVDLLLLIILIRLFITPLCMWIGGQLLLANRIQFQENFSCGVFRHSFSGPQRRLLLSKISEYCMSSFIPIEQKQICNL